MKHPRISKLTLVVAAHAALLTQSPTAFGQEKLEEVVVTGTRGRARSVFDSTAPIDVLTGDEFRNQGASDMTTLLRNSIPSFNVNSQPISDAATIVRPANLRGLAPDHTLILVNGKRRHRAAVITWGGNGVSDGAQGPDVSVIPAIALKQLEVLRDGAAAQYGSDAIAGVLNFILKDDAEGGSIEARYGEFTEGSEGMYSVSGNIGLPFTAHGFLNASFEYGESDATSRSIQRDDAAALIAGGNTAVTDPSQVWGSPEVRNDLKTFFNMGIDLSGNSQAYAFGNYASKVVEGGFFFRNPDTRSGVFANGDGNRLVGDVTGDMSGACPAALDPSDAAGLQAVIADPNCFVFNEFYPGGFTPSFGGNTEDLSLVVGTRGRWESGIGYDVSGSVGFNEADFFIDNTVNASLGPQSPTSFKPGTYSQLEKNFNFDLNYAMDVGLASDLNLATGFEWRDEEFEVGIGDEASWEVGPLADQGFSAASNGFPGFGPLAEGSWARDNVALYIDAETNLTDAWLVEAALRWEDFSDFGTTTNGKLSTHYTLTENVAVRASYSHGFRAPTPGQSNTFNVSTEFNVATGELENNGTIPPASPVAVLRGGVPLQPEESTNFSAGVIFEYGNLAVTADYFSIGLDDRLALSQNFELTDIEIAALIAAGVAGADSLSTFRFFTNGLNTETTGFDIVATYFIDSDLGFTDLNFSFNQTETEVTNSSDGVVDDARIQELEEGLPETRWNLMANHTMGDWRAMVRYSYYDDWYDSEDVLTYDSYAYLDAEIGYTVGSTGLSVVLGADNLLDETPDENPNAAAGVGNQYSQFAPAGFNGRRLYARVIYDF